MQPSHAFNPREAEVALGAASSPCSSRVQQGLVPNITSSFSLSLVWAGGMPRAWHHLDTDGLGSLGDTVCQSCRQKALQLTFILEMLHLQSQTGNGDGLQERSGAGRGRAPQCPWYKGFLRASARGIPV